MELYLVGECNILYDCKVLDVVIAWVLDAG